MQQLTSIMLPITPRLYQETIAAKAALDHTLVVLPTGLGKTVISLLVAINRLQKFPEDKVLILAPTKPLAAQHLKSFQSLIGDAFSEGELVLFTGAISPAKRADAFESAKIIFSTPQGLENDVLASRIRLKDVNLLVFDEAHRATGEYSYVWIAKQYKKQSSHPLIMGLTASPGTDKETVKEVIDNLGVNQIEYRDQQSPDVKPYIKETKLEYLEVDLPKEFASIHGMLNRAYLEKLADLKRVGFFQGKTPSQIRKLDLLQFSAQLRGRMAKEGFDSDIAMGLSVGAQALKIAHGVELCETQGMPPLYAYLKQLFMDGKAGKTKAAAALLQDPLMRAAYAKTKELVANECTHPKMTLLGDVVQKHLKPDAKIIVFSQYRDTLSTIKEILNAHDGVEAEMFVGQAKKKSTGMSQKQQLEMIERFKEGEFNVLCMSSVGEEGLDIPAVDLVVFYEPIPSAIRTIQRKGRTGRQEEGRVVVLMTRGTRDVAYRWVAMKKEKNMYTVLEDVKNDLDGREPVTLASFDEAKIEPASEEAVEQKPFRIIADSREKASGVLRALHDMPLSLEMEQLEVGDYCLSDDVAVEYKKVDDFVNSILDGRLLEQVKRMKECVLKPIIVVEGEESVFTQRNIHPNAIYGMISTLTLSFGVPVLFTRDEKDTANLLFMMARKEQDQSGSSSFNPHASNKPKSQKDQLEYIVGAIPTIGPSVAEKLLSTFGSLQDIAMASEEELRKIDGVGPTLAKTLKTYLELDYRKL